LYYMPTISVRITEEERKRLQRYGPLSETVRQALDLFEKERKKREWMAKLDRLQKENPIKLDSDEVVKRIREDRTEH
jgi:Arc/MetJ-type ribon-helix-helix transcriptional regulator